VSGQPTDTNSNLVVAGTSPVTKALEGPMKIHPYVSFGYKVLDTVIYISDVSHIPEATWALLEAPRRADPEHVYSVFVVDCLRFTPHTSHFGLNASVNAIRRLGARRSYLTGFDHDPPHDEYVAILEAFERRGDGVLEVISPNVDSEVVKRGLGLIEEGDSRWVRPAFDGLHIVVAADGSVTDSEY